MKGQAYSVTTGRNFIIRVPQWAEDRARYYCVPSCNHLVFSVYCMLCKWCVVHKLRHFDQLVQWSCLVRSSFFIFGIRYAPDFDPGSSMFGTRPFLANPVLQNSEV